jgi:hypothetical protein
MRKLSNEAYTPSYVIDPIREFFGGIDFDPFSCIRANHTIKAKNYCSYEFSAYLDVFEYLWVESKTIFANPEYSTKELTKALDKLFQHLEGKEVFLLLNSDTATVNYQRCLRRCDALLLFDKRIPFERPYSLPYSCPELFAPYAYKPNQNNSAQTGFYFGDRAIEFKKELSHLGHIIINFC